MESLLSSRPPLLRLITPSAYFCLMKTSLCACSSDAIARRPSSLLVALSLLALVPCVSAAVITHTLTSTGSNTWSSATWTNGAPTTSQGPGDTAGITFLGSVITDLNTDVTLGTLRSTVTGGGASWTINSANGSVITLNNTGSAGNSFIGTTGSGSITVNTNLLLTTTDLTLGQDTGAVANTSVTIGGTDHGEDVAGWSAATALSKEKWAQVQK